VDNGEGAECLAENATARLGKWVRFCHKKRGCACEKKCTNCALNFFPQSCRLLSKHTYSARNQIVTDPSTLHLAPISILSLNSPF